MEKAVITHKTTVSTDKNPVVLVDALFTFSPSRGMPQIHDQLGDFSGTLLTDGYSAYEKYLSKTPGLTHAQSHRAT
ncbi:MAG: transposase [Pseudomonadales bacterium]